MMPPAERRALLAGLVPVERATLAHLDDAQGTRITTIAAFTGFGRTNVRVALQSLTLRGFARLAPLADITGKLGGRGYVLTADGILAQRDARLEDAGQPPELAMDERPFAPAGAE